MFLDKILFLNSGLSHIGYFKFTSPVRLEITQNHETKTLIEHLHFYIKQMCLM